MPRAHVGAVEAQVEGRSSASFTVGRVVVRAGNVRLLDFSVELIAAKNNLSETGSIIFWMVVGIAGVAGGLAGELVTRFGLAKVLKWATLAIAASIASLTTASESILIQTLSAVMFGATFILITALYGIWVSVVFLKRPLQVLV